MKAKLGITNCLVIPNGVDLEEFVPDDQLRYKAKVGFDTNKKQIIWVSDPKRFEKNYDLAKESISRLSNPDVQLIVVSGKKQTKVKEFMLASDMLLLSSRWEGSPNVIKEAMALNIPIVTTDVGDVRNIIKNTAGCYIVNDNSNELARAIKHCLDLGKRTEGRKNLLDFDSRQIAQKIINLYNEIR
jgi:glycosyltransferase involved in cell wall biosynthesis